MGSGGVGSGQHLWGEFFKMMAGIDMVHVPYRGGGQLSKARVTLAIGFSDIQLAQIMTASTLLPESRRGVFLRSIVSRLDVGAASHSKNRGFQRRSLIDSAKHARVQWQRRLHSS